MEDVFADEPEIAIHRAGSAALKVPSHKSGILKVVYFGSEFSIGLIMSDFTHDFEFIQEWLPALRKIGGDRGVYKIHC